MKYISAKQSWRRVSPRVRVILLFFVVLPAMAILGAGIINKLIVAPYLNEEAKASETSIAASTGRIYSFYLIQAGVFSSEENAKAMASQIVAAGFKACSIKDEDLYRVVAGAAADKGSILQCSTSLQQAGYITLCKPFEIDENSLASCPEETEKYISAAGELINAMLEYASPSQKLDSVKTEKLEGYAWAVRKQYDKIKEMNADINEKFNISLLESLQEYLKQADNVDKRIEITWGCIASYGRMIKEISK